MSFRVFPVLSNRALLAQFPALSDNYGYLLRCVNTGATASIDAPDAETISSVAAKLGWKVTHILNTHKHWDHVGGNKELRAAGAVAVGPGECGDEVGQVVKENDTVELGELRARVVDVGGHTLGHIAYYFEADKNAERAAPPAVQGSAVASVLDQTETAHRSLVFSGDSLFALGCGRMFEGTPPQFFGSLRKYREMDRDSLVCCAHEYTEANARFAKNVASEGLPELYADGAAAELDKVIERVRALRADGGWTVPPILASELAVNPFLLARSADEFGQVRRMKDNFRG